MNKRPIALILSVALLVPYTTALAQQVDLKAVARLKQSLPIAELTDDYMAIKVSSAYSYDVGMVYYYSMLGAMFSGRSEDGAQDYVRFVDMLWTKGDVVEIGGEGYMACYRIEFSDLSIGSPSHQERPRVTSLRLHLVRISTIGALTPFSDVRAEDFRKSFVARSEDVEVIEDEPQGGQDRAVSNAKQIALGMMMYTTDYDDVLPYAQSTATVQWVTLPYMRNMKVWDTGNPSGSRFQFNMALAGVMTTAIEDVASTVMYYESAPWPDRRRVVAFTDGHVKLVTDEEWREVSKTLKLKLKKSAKKPLPANYGLKELAEMKSRGGG